MTAEQIAQELGKARRTSNGWTCLCPAHDDHNPSFSIADGADSKVIFKCFAGCTSDDVIAALQSRGLWPESGRGGTLKAQPARTPAPKRETASTARYAAEIWARTARDDGATLSHQYSIRKGVRHACGAGRATVSGRLLGKDADCLVVPIRLGGIGDVIAVQAINAAGVKQTFGPMADGFLLLGDERDQAGRWIVLEGWATACAYLRHWRRTTACVSFGKSRLETVAHRAAALFRPAEIVILDEDDSRAA